MATQKIAVIKVGTDVLTNVQAFSVIARQIAQIKGMGIGVVLVSSGGVTAGAQRVDFLGGKSGDYHKRFRASIGARHLLNLWGDAFALCQRDVAQCYVTYGNLRFSGERKSFRLALRHLAFDSFVVPLVNENDIVSEVEIKKMQVGLGDNDRLARVVACLVEASAIVFVTVKGGVYTANPEVDASAKLVPRIDAKRRFRINGKHPGPSKNGTGGMQSKVNQASICARRGMRAGIIGPREILQFLEGENVGTKVAV